MLPDLMSLDFCRSFQMLGQNLVLNNVKAVQACCGVIVYDHSEPSSDGNTIISNWCPEHDNEFTVLGRRPQSPDRRKQITSPYHRSF